jgi:hypothetical protein
VTGVPVGFAVGATVIGAPVGPCVSPILLGLLVTGIEVGVRVGEFDGAFVGEKVPMYVMDAVLNSGTAARTRSILKTNWLSTMGQKLEALSLQKISTK